jgi:hypothetical protein
VRESAQAESTASRQPARRAFALDTPFPKREPLAASSARLRLVTRTALAAVLSFNVMSAPVALALETDQYAAWTHPLEDAAAVINARFNLEITRALDDLDRNPAQSITCEAIAKAVQRRLSFEIFQPIELWVVQSPLVDQFPLRGSEAAQFKRHSIYRDHGPFDVGMWLPLAPTIEVAGVRFGTDKLAHFVSSGWKYRNAFFRHARRGRSEEEAVRAAIHWGIFEERGINGTLASGIFSRADLEADYQGMRFYLALCGGPDPLLAVDGGRWRLRRSFDVREYVTPEWDESYQTCIYSRSRWRKVRPEIVERCPLLAQPAVRQRFESYRARDRVTPTESVLTRLVTAGKLPDPALFELETICPAAASLPPRSSQPWTTPVSRTSGEDTALPARLEALEHDRSRRSFTLWSIGFADPRSVFAALGVLSASLPRTSDCHSVCDLRGPTVHLALGSTGGQVAVGWARAIAETGENGRILADVYLAYGVRGVIVRTWGDTSRAEANRTLAGIEGAFTITRVSFIASLLRRLGSDGLRGRWRVSAGLGLGF